MTEFPKELTPELRDVLGLMIYQTIPVAHALRAGGAKIPTKTEEEQAFVLHWMISLVLEHGTEWRRKVAERLKEIADAKPVSDAEGAAING